MPLARIDLIKGKPSDYRRTIGDVVYKAMVEILKAPENDRFQVINEHDADNFVYDPTFFGIERSADVVFVQLTLAEGRTLEQRPSRRWAAGSETAASCTRRTSRMAWRTRRKRCCVCLPARISENSW